MVHHRMHTTKEKKSLSLRVCQQKLSKLEDRGKKTEKEKNIYKNHWASLVAQLVNNPPAMRETWV